ncbi:unnamed protein product [Lupinus luteus]|uniref:S-protein homolog n=1 Tax=Lupinus luteus TaxID=3873 RepID=A0AAV1X648_LUPLU
MDVVEAFYLIPKVHIGITNNITDLPLTLHCKDKARDDGVHTLQYGEVYHFGFKTDIFLERTLWFCLFTWNGESHHFDIYVAKRDECPNCNWVIGKAGPCKVLDNSNENCFPWDDKAQHEIQETKKLLIFNTTTQQEPSHSLEPLNSQGRE